MPPEPLGLTLNEFFRNLSYGELSNLSIAVESIGTIKKSQQNRIVHYINVGLLALHERFPLIQETLVIPLTPGFGVAQTLPPDTIQVLSIQDPSGKSLDFTTVPRPKGIYIYNQILNVPSQDEELELTVRLQKRHPTLEPVIEDADLEQRIQLIPELHKALSAFVASEFYGTMGTQETLALSAQYRNRYEEICAGARNFGTLPSEIFPLDKFEKRGWV